MSDAERFWSYVRITDLGDCWLWQGHVGANGYAVFGTGPGSKRRSKGVHRWAYEQIVGPIPPGMQLDHVWARGCRHRHCVNPSHLEPVTPRENTMRSKVAPAAINAAKTHCQRHHEFTPENTYTTAAGSRVCKECNRAWQRGRRG